MLALHLTTKLLCIMTSHFVLLKLNCFRKTLQWPKNISVVAFITRNLGLQVIVTPTSLASLIELLILSSSLTLFSLVKLLPSQTSFT